MKSFRSTFSKLQRKTWRQENKEIMKQEQMMLRIFKIKTEEYATINKDQECTADINLL